jgi:hypothetical protein
MDLNTVLKRLNADRYTDPLELMEDVRLVRGILSALVSRVARARGRSDGRVASLAAAQQAGSAG